MSRPTPNGHLIASSAVLALLSVAATGSAYAASSNSVFTVGNYPVEARAANAVAAKDKAVSDGQDAAFRSLLKRIVPVTAYKQLKRLSAVKAGDLITGVSVRSERNSGTEYLASLDFSFLPDAVRSTLSRENIPFVDQQAGEVTIVPVVLKGDAIDNGKLHDDWRTAWSGLDLKNTLTPAKLDGIKPEIHRDTLKMMLGGEGDGLRILRQEYQSERVLLVIAEPDVAAKKMTVTLAGQDAVGPILLKRSYRVSDGDFAYTAELAAVVALGVLEGRWKAIKAGVTAGEVAATPSAGQPVWAAAGSGSGDPVQLFVEFSNQTQWNDIRAQLLDTPGVEALEVGPLSARTADVSLKYPGGAQSLANAVGARGLTLINSSQGWVLRSSY